MSFESYLLDTFEYFEHLLKKYVTNVHATELKAVGIAMVQKVKETIKHAYERNTRWQSRKHRPTKKTI